MFSKTQPVQPEAGRVTLAGVKVAVKWKSPEVGSVGPPTQFNTSGIVRRMLVVRSNVWVVAVGASLTAVTVTPIVSVSLCAGAGLLPWSLVTTVIVSAPRVTL